MTRCECQVQLLVKVEKFSNIIICMYLDRWARASILPSPNLFLKSEHELLSTRCLTRSTHEVLIAILENQNAFLGML